MPLAGRRRRPGVVPLTARDGSTLRLLGSTGLQRRGSPDQNTAILQRWIEAWNAHDAEGIGRLVTVDEVGHHPNAR